MAVTKQTYTISAPHTRTDVEAALESALIDAGLMTAWHDAFNAFSGQLCRVMEIEHDGTKTYGTNYHYFSISNTAVSVALATGWQVSSGGTNGVPTGTQYLDWHTLPADIGASNNGQNTVLFTYSTTSDLFLDRFTSGDDAKQSWFVFRQLGASPSNSRPFTFLHEDTVLHPWFDLDKGCISGLVRAEARVFARAGYVDFRIDEALRRCLGFGSMLRGFTTGGASQYHNAEIRIASYVGVGTAVDTNFPFNRTSTPLPIGRNINNSEFATDYLPICTNLPWSYYTPTRLADDFGIYMQYANNDIAYGDKFIVQSAVNEWEVMDFANNVVVTDGASASFLARVV